MRTVLIVTISVLVCCIGMAMPGISFGEARNSINIGGAVGAAPSATASAFLGEYERSLNNKLSVLGRVGSYTYSFDDGTYVENNDGSGVDFGVRIYPMGGMKGLYFGGAFGFWSSDWTFTDDKGKSYQTQGKGSSDAVRLDLEIGGRFPLGRGPVSLMPSFHLGNFFSTDSSCTYTSGPYVGSCTKDSNFGVYSYLGLSVGIAF